MHETDKNNIIFFNSPITYIIIFVSIKTIYRTELRSSVYRILYSLFAEIKIDFKPFRLV